MAPETSVPQPAAEPDRAKPTAAQKRYLARGLAQPGGKLPLFDAEGQLVARQTVESCIAHGWAEAWIANPTKPDWLVCRLTRAGYRVLGATPPESPGETAAGD